MALSKDTFRPIYPKDLHNNVRRGRAATGSNFTAGTLVVRVNNLLVAADTDVAIHETLPTEMIWEDGTTRVDLERYTLSGTKVQEYTTLTGFFIAEVATSLFTATPNAGELIVKSATAGSLDPLTGAEYATLLASPEDQTHLVGKVVGAAEVSGAGFWLCHFNLV